MSLVRISMLLVKPAGTAVAYPNRGRFRLQDVLYLLY